MPAALEGSLIFTPWAAHAQVLPHAGQDNYLA